MSLAWPQIAREVAERCSGAGLDLVQPFPVALYNREVDAPLRLPDFGRPAALGLLIANSRALWPRFVAALRAEPGRLALDDPLDAYAAAAMRDALQPLTSRWELRTAPEPPPRRVALQRLAHLSGLAHLAPSLLCVHPHYGPWIGLRGAVVIDVDGPPASTPLANPCGDCAQRCVPLLERALAAAQASPSDADGEGWRRWLAVRDACPVGRAHRYDEAQLRYHYVKDRLVLERLARDG